LVKARPHREPPDPNLNVEFVPVLECGDAVTLMLAQGTLEDAGIPYVIKNLRFGIPLLEYRASIADVPCTLQVPRVRSRHAHALLTPLESS